MSYFRLFEAIERTFVAMAEEQKSIKNKIEEICFKLDKKLEEKKEEKEEV